MDNEKWNTVLIDWVNCLKLCKHISGIEELRNGEFFSNLQKVITKSCNVQQDVLTFVFDLFGKHYPNYIFENTSEVHLADLSELDLKALTSLLMHYTCIYDRKDVLTSPLCHSLSQSTQLIIRNYLEKTTSNVTSATMNNIIKCCIDDASDHLTNQWLTVETSSATNSPLQDLLKTPMAKFGRLQEKDRIISKLKTELEVERFDKAELQEDLKRQLEKNNKIEQQIVQKNNEILRLRAEVLGLENRTPPHFQDMDSRELQRRLRSEIESLESYIKQIEEEQDGIIKERDVLKEQLRKFESQSRIWEEKFFEIEHNFESLKEDSKQKEKELVELQAHCVEITAILDELKRKPDHDSSFYDTLSTSENGTSLNEKPICEELACSLVEGQLREAQKLNEELKIQVGEEGKRVSDLTVVVAKIEAEKKRSEEKNEELATKLRKIEQSEETLQKRLLELQNCLRNAENKIEEKNAEVVNLTIELNSTSENLSKLDETNKGLHSKVSSLESSLETMEKQLLEISSKLETEKKRSEVFRNERDTAKTVSEKLQFELADVILNSQKLALQLDDLKGANENLLSKLDDAEATRGILENHLHDSRKRSDSLEAELGRLQAEYNSARAQFYETRVEFDEQKAQMVERLMEANDKFGVLEKTNEELKTQDGNLQQQLKEALSQAELSRNLTKKVEESKNIVDKKLLEVESSVEKLEIANVELQNEKKQITRLLEDEKNRLSKVEEERLSLKEKITGLEKSELDLTVKNQGLSAQVDSFQNQLKDVNDLLEENIEQSKKLKECYDRLLIDLDAAQASSQQSLEEAEKKGEEIKKLTEDLHKIEFTLQTTEENVQIVLKEKEELNEIIENLKGETLNLREENKNLTDSRCEIEGRLTARLEILEENKNTLQTLLDAAINSNQHLEEKIFTVRKESDEHCAQLESEKVAVENKLCEAQTSVKDLQLKLSSVEEEFGKKVKKLLDNNQCLTDDLEKMQIQSDELKKKKDGLQEQLQTSVLKSEELGTVVENLQKQLSEDRKTITDSKNNEEILQQKLLDLYVVLEDTQLDTQKANEDLMNVKNQNQMLISKLEDYEAKCLMLEQKVTEVINNLIMSNEESGELRKKLEEERVVLTSKLTFLTENLNSMECKNRELSEQNSYLEQQKVAYQELINGYEVSKESIQELLDGREEIIKLLEDEKEVLMAKFRQLEDRLKNSERKSDDIWLEYENLEKRAADLLATNEAIMTEKLTYQKSLKDKEAIQEQLQTVKDELMKQQSENDELIVGNSTLNGKLIQKEIELQDNKKSTNNLTKEKKEMEIKINEYCKDIEDLKNQKESYEKQISALEVDYKQLKNYKDITERQLEEVSVLSETLKAEAEEVRLHYQKSTNELREARQILEKLQTEKDVLVLSLKEAEGEKDKVQKSVDVVKGKLEKLELETQNLKREKELLNSKNEDLEKHVFEVEKKKEEDAIEISKIMCEVGNWSKRAETAEDTLENRDRDIVLLNEKLEHLAREKDKLVVTLKETKDEKEEIQKTVDILKEKLAKLELEFQNLDREKEMLIFRNEELEKAKEGKETVVSQLLSEVEIMTKQAETTAGKLENSEKEIISLNEKLQHQAIDNNELLLSLEKTRAEKDVIEQTVDVMKEKLVKLELESQNLYREKETLISKNEDLENEIVGVEKEMKDLNRNETDVSKLMSEVENLTKRSETAENKLDGREKEIISLNEKIERLGTEKSVLDKKIEVEELISAETRERAKLLEETVQDYEITISGLKKVVDTNLDRLESLKEELSEQKKKEVEIKNTINKLLLDNNIIIDKPVEDFKYFICQQFESIVKAKNENEKRIQDLECEITELGNKNLAVVDLNATFTEMVEKLQGLVNENDNVCSMSTLKSRFDDVHLKVNTLLLSKQQLLDDLRKAESDNNELRKHLETLKIDNEEISNAKIALEETLKSERDKVDILRKEIESKTKSLKPEKENILGVSTKSNKSREEELKKENMMLKRKLVLTENAKNNIEKVLKELREEKKKTMSPPSPDVLYKKLLHEYIQVKEENEQACKERDVKIQELSNTIQQLTQNNPIKTEDNKKLQNIRDAYGNLMSINSKLELEVVTLRKKIEERNSEMADLSHIKEAYEKLLEENNKMITEVDTLKYKRMRDKEEFVRLLKKERDGNDNHELKKIQEIRSEYEGKLEKMKEKMLKLYRDEVNKKVRSLKDGQNETATFMKTIGNLRSELFEAEQKIQLLEMEKEILKSNRHSERDIRMVQVQSLSSMTSISTKPERSATLPRQSLAGSKEMTISQCTSVGSGMPNLQMEDEEDLFNDKYLTDLKEGKCIVPGDRNSTARFSELAWRNSMVPPHLKSSYPAETQFMSPNRFRDDDLKMGNIELEDSLCKLLPGEKPRKKDFGTTSYKRPGPPTPSKNGGRLSLQGNEVHPMREHCEARTPKRSTPSRIKALFTGRNSSSMKDASENTSTPNRGRRLNIFRRPR